MNKSRKDAIKELSEEDKKFLSKLPKSEVRKIVDEIVGHRPNKFGKNYFNKKKES